MKPKLIFTERALPFVLEALNFQVDEDDCITTEGEKINISKIGGFYKGEVIKNDLFSIMEFVEKNK